MKGYRKYFKKKIIIFLITFVISVILNFILPRLMPADPVSIITARTARAANGLLNTDAVNQIYEFYAHEFGTDKPIFTQFLIYVKNIFTGEFGLSFSQYPRPVSDIISHAIGYTLALQLPAIIVGWFIGNMLGVLAAYRKKIYDKLFMPLSMFISGIPAFGSAIILLLIFAVTLGIAPLGGFYDKELFPGFNLPFIMSVISHYQLPFWSIVIIIVGGQAIGMRSMSIYELNADYIKYCRLMGINDRKIAGYIFRNAMLPQVTGLALSLGTMVGGALVAETIFSYPGLGAVIMRAVNSRDYPLLSATTLIITMMVLIATFSIDIIYGFIDPRIKAEQFDA